MKMVWILVLGAFVIGAMASSTNVIPEGSFARDFENINAKDPSRVTNMDAEWKTLQKNKMTVRWKFEGERIHFEVSAPQRGWVAIGFNPKSGLAGTNLIMGAVKGDETTVSDRYVRKPGDHQAIADLGGQPQIADVSGAENAKGTTVCFSLPIGHTSEHHYPLEPGRKYYLLLAYSMDDDFGHHSVMRTETTIEL